MPGPIPKSGRINGLRLFTRVAFVLGLALPFLPPLAAQSPAADAKTAATDAKREEKIQTTADSLDFDQKTGEIIARGHVVVTQGNTRLLADQAQINRETKQARAEGNVRLRQGYKEWVSESLDYNFATGAIKAGKARAELDDGLFVESASMESPDRDRLVLKNAYLTTSDYDKPGYRLKAGSIVLYPDKRVVFYNLVLYIGPVPVFYFPVFALPLDDSQNNGINTGTQVQIGSKGTWGFFILNSYTDRFSEDVRPTFHLDYRSHQGVAGGIDLRYRAGEKYDPAKEGEFQPRVSGKITTYYADDNKIRKSGPTEVVTSTGSTTQKIAPERYRARVSQRADLRDDLYSKLKAEKLSDANLLEDFFEKEFQRDPQPDNFFEFTKWSPNTTASFLTRGQINNFYTVTERLPEVRYDLNRQPVFGGPFFYEGENSVAYLSKEFSSLTPAASPDYHTARLDSFHQFLYPKQYFKWLNVTPRVGGRATYYDQSGLNASQPAVTRGVFNTGVEFGFKTTRTWKNASDKRWEIDGLRHVVEPHVNYAFVLKPNRTPGELPQFDVARNSFGINKRLIPIDFPQFTAVDSINKRNVFRPSLRQRLQTKRDGQPWDLAELLLYQDILADKVAGEQTLSDLFTEFSVKPTRWLALDWHSRYDYDNNQIRESTTSASVFKGKIWKVTVGHDYFRTVGNQMSVGYALALNEDWTLRTAHRFDPANGSLFEQAYAVDRDLHSWVASLSVSQLRPQNQPADLRIWLTFTLKAFPEVTVDSRQVGPSNN